MLFVYIAIFLCIVVTIALVSQRPILFKPLIFCYAFALFIGVWATLLVSSCASVDTVIKDADVRPLVSVDGYYVIETPDGDYDITYEELWGEYKTKRLNRECVRFVDSKDLPCVNINTMRFKTKTASHLLWESVLSKEYTLIVDPFLIKPNYNKVRTN